MTVATPVMDPKADQPVAEMIPVARIFPTPFNKRRFRVNVKFEQLCANIKLNGVIQPGVARRVGVDGEVRYELIAGRRRYEACITVGRAFMPVVVRELTDQEAVDIVNSENFGREDLTPIEEAESIQLMLDMGRTVEEIADRFGVSKQWVARRAQLVKLTKIWLNAIDKGGWAVEYSAALLEIVAKLASSTQDAVFHELADNEGSIHFRGKLPTAKTLQQFIDEHFLHVLSGAPWRLDDDTLDPKAGACNACPKRISAQPLLFGEDEPDSKRKTQRDQCLDLECYRRKQAEAAERNVVELTVDGKPPVLIIGDDTPNSEVNTLIAKRGAVHEHAPSIRVCDRKTAGAEKGVVISGSNTGHVLWCTREKSRSSGSAATAGKAPLTDQERKERLKKRRRVWVIHRVRMHLEELREGKKTTVNDLALSLEDLVQGRMKGLRPSDVIRLILAFGTVTRAASVFDDLHGNVGWNAYGELAECTDDDLDKHLWENVIENWIRRLTNPQDVQKCFIDVENICELLKWKLDWLWSLAEEAIPTPKNLVLAAAASPKNARTGKPDPVLGMLPGAGKANKAGKTKGSAKSRNSTKSGGKAAKKTPKAKTKRAAKKRTPF